MLTGLAHLNTYAQEQHRSETIRINGKNIYFEKYGVGEPLIFLHGYGQSSMSWRPYVADFEKDFSVYLIDLPGHGKSDIFDDDLSLKAIAEDLNQLLVQLRLTEIKAIGFSFGADVLFQMALINPQLITSMISIGSVGSWTIEDFPQLGSVFTFENRKQFPWLVAAQSNEEQVKILMEQFQNYSIHLSDKELQQIQAKVLIMSGDDDEGVDLYEIARIKKYLPQAAVWILPNVKHSAHTGTNTDSFIAKARTFLTKTN